MTLADLLRWLFGNVILLVLRQRLTELKLKRLEDEVKALRQQGPNSN